AIPGVFTPYRIPRLAIAGLLVAAILVAAPLLVTSPAALSMQYHQWAAHSSLQSATLRGYSVMEHLHLWLGVDWPNKPIQVIGVVILLAPLSQIPHWGSERFRRLFLASVLMFCVLFNHKAESPSFVIAVAVVAIWFAISDRDRFAWTVLAIVFVGTVVSSSEAMPAVLRHDVFQAYKLKTLPILLV